MTGDCEGRCRVYNGPGGKFTIIGMMPAGTQAKILQHDIGGWCRLQGWPTAATAGFPTIIW